MDFHNVNNEGKLFFLVNLVHFSRFLGFNYWSWYSWLRFFKGKYTCILSSVDIFKKLLKMSATCLVVEKQHCLLNSIFKHLFEVELKTNILVTCFVEMGSSKMTELRAHLPSSMFYPWVLVQNYGARNHKAERY